MSGTDPKLVAEIDAIEDEIIEAATDIEVQVGLGAGGGGGAEPTGGPYKPTDDPLLTPTGGPYKPTGEPETNGGPYKPTDEPAAATQGSAT